ncbi:MAG: ATP-dependent sacrificial sulfur transferase LarE [Nitrospirae bacterium]|nr:ATP-dependent sacrificial sulfur transferase LarE [Nitrospirota bacterium]
MNGGRVSPAGQKFSRLLSLLKDSEGAIIAFSGGVDSTFLLKAMKMSGMKVLAVTAVSETMPERDRLDADAFARDIGVEHLIIQTEELRNEAFASNPPDRCFFCKDELFRKIRTIAEEKGFCRIFDGSNKDDLHDYRPGRKAAEAHGIRSPLVECGISKEEVRHFSRELGLSSWNKPSSPCLSSRFPYGLKITAAALQRVRDAEDYLRSCGLSDVRVRDYGETARIEVREEDMYIFLDQGKRRLVVETLKSLGYKFVSLDLEGYRSGSMNRVLENAPETNGITLG